MTRGHVVTVYFHGDQERTLDIVFSPREYGGWDVHHAHSGRQLGWITYDRTKPVKTRWEARTGDVSFRGDGRHDTADEGHVLDEVPSHLSARCEPGRHSPVGLGRSRADALYNLLYWLCRQSAPAVGFGPHKDVHPWTSKVCM